MVGFIARLFGRLLPFVPGLLFGKKQESEAAAAVENGQGGWVIAIGRQYGSGGRVIGQKLAQRLGYEFEIDHPVDGDHTCIRLVTSWATPETAVEDFLRDLAGC